jgi:hypothetical protein
MLPIPPYHKLADFFLLVNIIKKFQNAIIEAFGIGNHIRPREHGCRRKRETNLWRNGEVRLHNNINSSRPYLRSDISDRGLRDSCHAMDPGIARACGLGDVID